MVLTTLFYAYYEGAIELSILADYYGREIAAYDIQTGRCDLYGQVRSMMSSLWICCCHLVIIDAYFPLLAMAFLTGRKLF